MDFSSANVGLIEEMYERYLKAPSSVDSSWQRYFEQLDAEEGAHNAAPAPAPEPPAALEAAAALHTYRLIDAYRTYGHLLAQVNPIAKSGVIEPEELKLENLGFSRSDLNRIFPACGVLQEEEAPLAKIIAALKQTYCGKIGVEYMGLQRPDMVRWLQKQIEPTRFQVKLTIDQKRMILQQLNKSELFESFLHTKYVGQKRFSLEGGETLIPMLAALIEQGSEEGIGEFAIGMAHRGRLNVLCNILDKSYRQIFSEFEERYIPNSIEGSGDVKYHKGFSSTLTLKEGRRVQVDLTPNPSHLEAVNPVVEGLVRAKQDALKEQGAAKKILPILVHGDAAISGQGIIYETLQMYRLDGYSTGGTLHFVINNQIGFTTLPEEGRSTLYCTDIARAFGAPVFHVNGEDPEGCVFATVLALQIRQKFGCDVFIDLSCYRKYGHNETDEPAFTQPHEYRMIRQKKPIREIYRDDLIQQGVLERQMAEALEKEFKEALAEALESTKQESRAPERAPVRNRGSGAAIEANMLAPVSTGVDAERLREVGERMTEIPSGFTLHKKLRQLMEARRAMAEGKEPLDWGMAELLAYGTLLREGRSVRLAGQDSGRGTFSHRHAVWMDQEEEKIYIPLQHLDEGQGSFFVVNSLLSEYAALGFEYGYSLGAEEALVLWEAQFGDFANGAQVMIDQFIASSEQKWGQKNGVTLLLPHGYEGQGPEHSSGRIERFLSLAANCNMFVVYPTTPGQLFHLLRRQLVGNGRKPLVVFTPKGLLRHPACKSDLYELASGAFQEVLDDPQPPEETKKLLLCSGKVYYDLKKEREERGAEGTAIVRIEQLYPLHAEKLHSLLRKYIGFEECLWVQEEPSNMGGWDYIRPLLYELLPESVPLRYAGRERSAASATGSVALHKQQYAAIMEQVFKRVFTS